MARNYSPGETLAERFGRQTADGELPADPSLGRCLLWTGNLDTKGYGRICFNYRTRKAHRVAWELAKGEAIPNGLLVLHRCDNPPCVNPEHLFLGTHADNMRDKTAKGRGTHGDDHWTRRFPEKAQEVGRRNIAAMNTRRGEEMPTHKLTEAQVREIRATYVPRRISYPVLGRRYGVSAQMIKNIVLRKNWTHI